MGWHTPVFPGPRRQKQEDEAEMKTSKKLLTEFYSARFLGFCFYFKACFKE